MCIDLMKPVPEFVDETNQVLKHIVCYCPNPRCVLGDPPIFYQKPGNGFTNAYSHMITCYGGVKNNAAGLLEKLHAEAKAAKDEGGGSILGHFKANSATAKEKSMVAWIKIIVKKSQPISIVADPLWRSFHHDTEATHISVKSIKAVLFTLTEMVEASIAAELTNAKVGALMHDAWTKASIHYMGVFACYNREITVTRDKKPCTELKATCTLLSVAPMAQLEPKIDEETATLEELEEAEGEATSFNAKTMAQHFTTILEAFYGIILASWVMCVIADNASVNRLCALILEKAVVGCSNHKFSLDVGDGIKSKATLNGVFDRIHAIMVKLKSLKNAAVLRNMTNLKPVLDIVTRWSAKFNMAIRFARLRPFIDAIIEAEEAGESDSNLGVLSAEIQSLSMKVDKATKWLEQVNIVTKYMQTRMITLAACRTALDTLADKINWYRAVPGHVFFGCPVVLKRSAPDSTALSPDLAFEKAVIKIQRNAYHSLTDAEKLAVHPLLKTSVGEEEPAAAAAAALPGSPGLLESITQREHARASGLDEMSPYVNCDFICGSAAEVERLWSTARYILTSQRRSMSPLVFETLLFLKTNQRFWDHDDIILEAIGKAKFEARSAKIQERLEEEAQEQETIVLTEEDEE